MTSPFKIVFQKVQALGIKGMAYRWIEDWLKNRMQRVQFGNACPDRVPVLNGVLQESVLSCIIFLIYINDINDGVDSKILKFADALNCTGV
jgi:hypothetical protein